MTAAKVTGMGIAILNDNQSAYVKGFGYRDAQKQLPLSPATVLYGASFAKAEFACLVMQFVEEGRIDLDKPLFAYLPKPLPEYEAYRDLAGDERANKITARMALSHTTGFANWRRFDEGGKLRIHFEPGTRFAYSGEGVELLQLVVESVTQNSTRELMRDRIFAPAAMTQTSMLWEERFEENFANGYDQRGRSLGPERRTRVQAAGSMVTSVADVARFLEALRQGRLLSKKMRNQMLSPQIAIVSKHEFPSLSPETTEENKPIGLSYGLGFGLFFTPRGKAYFKEGHLDGWEHHLVCFDEANTCMVLMTNSSNGDGIFRELLKRLIGDTYTPWKWEGYVPYQQKEAAAFR